LTHRILFKIGSSKVQFLKAKKKPSMERRLEFF
jgi:hypothetical protein